MAQTEGERLFARYASSPNLLGYCGPAIADGLVRVARGEDVDLDVRAVAAGFSGAWAYQCVLGEILGLDPMHPDVVRGYWIAGGAIDDLDPDDFWRRLLAVIGPQAGSYWSHLNDALAREAACTHAFHVLGVYPWTRLLHTGRPEPLQVLDSCCIHPATVVEITAEGLSVEGPALAIKDAALAITTRRRNAVAAPFDEALEVGDRVALHWGSVCDVLDPAQADRLQAQLAEQLARTNQRLRAR